MGKMLEALRRAGNPSLTDGATELTAGPPPAAHDEPAETAPGEEMPFIEVGGRGRAVDGSPSVIIACAPVPAALVDRKVRLDPPAPRTPVFTDGGQRGFSFQTIAPEPPARLSRVAPEVIAYHDPGHAVSEQYRALFARIQESLLVNEPHILLFTAVAAGTGTTTALLNLAVTGCGDGKRRVAVVDANLARPAVVKRLGMVHAAGLAEVLNGTTALEQALAASPQPRLHVLAGTTPGHTGALLKEENVRWLAARLRERYDLILVDGPVWEADNDAAALGAVADAVYLVLDAGASDSPAVRKVTRTLAQRGCRLGGLILAQ